MLNFSQPSSPVAERAILSKKLILSICSEMLIKMRMGGKRLSLMPKIVTARCYLFLLKYDSLSAHTQFYSISCSRRRRIINYNPNKNDVCTFEYVTHSIPSFCSFSLFGFGSSDFAVLSVSSKIRMGAESVTKQNTNNKKLYIFFIYL